VRLAGPTIALGVVGIAASAHAAESNPESVVRAFIGAASDDRVLAQSMLAKGAGFGAGDVGGPFEFAVLDEFAKSCRFDTSTPVTKPLGMEGRDIVTVEVDLVCQADGHIQNTLPAAFMVEGGKIAGLYLNVRSGLDRTASGGAK